MAVDVDDWLKFDLLLQLLLHGRVVNYTMAIKRAISMDDIANKTVLANAFRKTIWCVCWCLERIMQIITIIVSPNNNPSSHDPISSSTNWFLEQTKKNLVVLSPWTLRLKSLKTRLSEHVESCYFRGWITPDRPPPIRGGGARQNVSFENPTPGDRLDEIQFNYDDSTEVTNWVQLLCISKVDSKFPRSGIEVQPWSTISIPSTMLLIVLH